MSKQRRKRGQRPGDDTRRVAATQVLLRTILKGPEFQDYLVQLRELDTFPLLVACNAPDPDLPPRREFAWRYMYRDRRVWCARLAADDAPAAQEFARALGRDNYPPDTFFVHVLWPDAAGRSTLLVGTPALQDEGSSVFKRQLLRIVL
jgi:hypothetical protein